MQNIILFIISIFLFVLFCTPVAPMAFTQNETLLLRSQLIANSPTRAAMGECWANIIDEQSAIYNPGALGIFHLNKVFFIAIPHKTELFPNRSNYYIHTFSIGGGLSYRLIKPQVKNRLLNLSLSVAYSEVKIDYSSWFSVSGGCPPKITKGMTYERHQLYSISLGIEYLVRAGVGLTYKRVSTIGYKIFGRTEVLDYGLIVEFPIMKFLYRKSPPLSNVKFVFTPSFSFIKINDGGTEQSIYSNPPPLNSFYAFSYSLTTAVNYRNVQIASFRMILELPKRGFEIGACDIFYYRWGFIDWRSYGPDQKTSGYGIYLRGILSYLKILGMRPRNAMKGYLFDHLDLSYEYARYHNNGYGMRGNMKFIRFSLSL